MYFNAFDMKQAARGKKKVNFRKVNFSPPCQVVILGFRVSTLARGKNGGVK